MAKKKKHSRKRKIASKVVRLIRQQKREIRIASRRSLTKRDEPPIPNVPDRLHYLWTLLSSTSMAVELAKEPVTTSTASHGGSEDNVNLNESAGGRLSVLHRLARDFMRLVKENAIELPPPIQEKMCRSCCVVLVPALTSSIRLRKRTRKSGVNRSNPDRMRTELIERCLMCGKVRKAAALYRNTAEPLQNTPSIPSLATATDITLKNHSRLGVGETQATPVSAFNLLELERTIKKKRRLTLGPTTASQRYNRNRWIYSKLVGGDM